MDTSKYQNGSLRTLYDARENGKKKQEEYKEEENGLKPAYTTSLFLNVGSYDNNTLNSYLKHIREYKVLTLIEEKELFARVQQGDEDARTAFIQHNLRLVIWGVKRYGFWMLKANLASFFDLIQEGNKGLMRAVEKFDPTLGRFSTYAAHWIRQAVQQYYEDNARIVRLPNNKQVDLSRVLKAQQTLLSSGKTPSEENIAKLTNMKPEKVKILVNLSKQRVVSLDKPRPFTDSNTEHTPALGGLLKEKDVKIVEDVMDEHIFQSAVQAKLKSILTEKEFSIISLRFGFSNKEEFTLEDIAKLYGVTSQRIRQIQGRIFEKVAKSQEILRLLKSYDFKFDNKVLELEVTELYARQEKQRLENKKSVQLINNQLSGQIEIKKLKSVVKKLSVIEIVKIVADFYKVDESSFYKRLTNESPKRSEQVVMYLLKEEYRLEPVVIGRKLGNQSEIEVLTACDNVSQNKISFRDDLDKLMEILSTS